MFIRKGLPGLLFLSLLITGGFAAAGSQGMRAGNIHLVLNPYGDIDWQVFQQHKANFHTHTTESEGEMSPAGVIDKYLDHGCTVLALTDHNICTYPWEKFDRIPSSLGMVAVAGTEHSCPHHVVSLFCKYEPEQHHDLDPVLEGIREKKGLAILCHPGEYWMPDFLSHHVPEKVAKEYTGIFRKHSPYLLGMEIFNSGYRWRFDPILWDELLTELMPDRPVWGFAADDMHYSWQIGRDWNILVMPALTEKDARESMEKGRFYFSTLGTHGHKEKDVEGTPVIKSIVHDPKAGTITIYATDRGKPVAVENCRWISGGKVVHTGLSVNYRAINLPAAYIRAELAGSGGTTFTNPFGFDSMPRRVTR